MIKVNLLPCYAIILLWVNEEHLYNDLIDRLMSFSCSDPDCRHCNSFSPALNRSQNHWILIKENLLCGIKRYFWKLIWEISMRLRNNLIIFDRNWRCHVGLSRLNLLIATTTRDRMFTLSIRFEFSLNWIYVTWIQSVAKSVAMLQPSLHLKHFCYHCRRIPSSIPAKRKTFDVWKVKLPGVHFLRRNLVP